MPNQEEAMKRLFIIFLVSFILIFQATIIFAVGEQEAPEELVEEPTTVNMAFIYTGPESLDPQKAQILDSWQVLYNICEGLVTYDSETLMPAASLAKSWDISTDGLKYTFHLRKGVRFHNGREMTAKDVKYSFDRLANPNTGTTYTASMLKKVAGFKEMRDEDTMAKSLSGVRIIDDYTIEVNLTSPLTSFLSQLALPGSYIVPKEAAEKKDFNENPIGTGPYKLVEWSRNNRVVLEANEDYWGDTPTIKKAILHTILEDSKKVIEYEAGNLDIVRIPEPDLPRLLSNNKLSNEVHAIPILSTFHLRINLKDPIMSNIGVRRALSIAIDRQAIIDTVLYGFGTPAYGVFPYGLTTYDEKFKPFTYDINKAKKLLSEAGYKDGVELTVTTGTDKTMLRVLEAIQRQVAKAGIRLTIKIKETDLFHRDRANCNLQTCPIFWVQDYPDAENFGMLIAFTDCGIAACGYNIYPNVDAVFKLLDKASETPYGSERDKLYREAQRIAMEQAVLIPVYHGTRNMLINPRLKGIVVDGASIVRFATIEIDEN